MTNEIQTGNQVISGVEVLIATLANWHAFVDVYVDGSADAKVPGSIWRVYAVTAGTRTLLASGEFNATDPTQGERVLSKVPGLGATIELRAVSLNGPSAGPIRAAIVGWDPATPVTNASDVTDAAVSLVPGAEVNVAALVWHPKVSVMVQGPAQARGSLWNVRAVIAGLASQILVGGAFYGGQAPARVVVEVEGGASSWILSAVAPAGVTGPVTAAIEGNSPAVAAVGAITAAAVSYVDTAPLLGSTNVQGAIDALKGSGVLLAGDLLGTGSTAAVPRVGSLTGIAGTLALAATAALMQWAAATVTPTISQASTGNATGATMAVKAQNALTTGGKLILSSGTGVTPGNVELQLGGVANVTLSPTAATFANPLIASALDAPGATTLQLGTSNAASVAVGVVGRFTNILGAATVASTLAVGAAPATVGDVRVPGSSEYRFGVANICAFSTAPNSGPGAELIVGSDFAGAAGVVNAYVNGNTAVYITQGTATVTHQFTASAGVTKILFYKDQVAILATRTNQDLALGTNSLARLTLSSALGAFSVAAVSIGASPAGAGTIRTPQSTEFRFNNGGTDICALSTGGGGGASGSVAIGADQAGANGVSQVSLNARDGGNIFLAFGATNTIVGYQVVAGTTFQRFWADAPATIELRSIGVATGSPLSIFGQPTTTIGGDLLLGGGDTRFGGTAGFVDFRNQVIGTGGGSIAGGKLLTGLLAKTVPIKVDGAPFFMVLLG